MRKRIAIIVCKILSVIGKILGKGSSLPGKIALKICPDILGEIKLPKYVVAFTGSNGKTSATEMIAEVLRKNGMKVVHNKEGSNQIEGITTLILKNATLSGRVLADVLVLESDERYARHSFKFFTPTHYVINNLYRDQLTRNGHPSSVFDAILESIHGGKLILNADDPLVSAFGEKFDAVYFSMDENNLSSKTQDYAYSDGEYCPICMEKMHYEYYHYNQIGKFSCEKCAFKSHDASYKITNVDLEKMQLFIDEKHKINLAFSSLYNAYNILAVYALCRELSVESKLIVDVLNNYVMKNDRISEFSTEKKSGKLFTSKHENSVSYNQSITMALFEKKSSTIMVLVDAISRKYYTCETSWLWDIDFERLSQNENIKEIQLVGTYCYDLELRFRDSGLNYKTYENVHQAITEFDENESEQLVVITCFSDRDKVLCEVKK